MANNENNGKQRQTTANNGKQRQATPTNSKQQWQTTPTNSNQLQPTATNCNQLQPTATNNPRINIFLPGVSPPSKTILTGVHAGLLFSTKNVLAVVKALFFSSFEAPFPIQQYSAEPVSSTKESSSINMSRFNFPSATRLVFISPLSSLTLYNFNSFLAFFSSALSSPPSSAVAGAA